MTLPPAVLWADPGMMSGLACLLRGRFYADEFRFIEAGDMVSAFCQNWGSQGWVGWETYNISARLPQQDAHYAIEMIGVIRREATLAGCRILTPAAPADRKLATTAMLQAIGWWVPAKDDAQSAAQHLLSWLHREHEVPPRERELLERIKTRR